MPKGNYLHSLTQPGIIWQRPFEFNENEYDQIRYKILSMVHVKHNNNIGRNIMNEYDIEKNENV